MTKFRDHLGKGLPAPGLPTEKSVLKRFFRYEDKIVWLTPFSYSDAREKVGGFNDEEHFLINSKTKIPAREYFKMAEEFGPDFVVTPCEQVTHESGKKKRKRSLKASVKHAKTLAKLLLDSPEHPAVLSSVMLGDEGGLDNFEMRHYAKEVFGADDQEEDPERAINQLDGFMIYGTDVLSAPQAYQDVKDFLAMTP